MFAVLGDFPECVEVLLKHGSRCEVRDRSGRSALHWAAHHARASCLKVLLARKKPTADGGWAEADRAGVTLLHLATRYPEKKCLPMIFKHYNIGAGDIDVQVSGF